MRTDRFCLIHTESAHLDVPEDGTRACKTCVDAHVDGLRGDALRYTAFLRKSLTIDEWLRLERWAKTVGADDFMPYQISILIALVLAAERHDKSVDAILREVQDTGRAEVIISQQVSSEVLERLG